MDSVEVMCTVAGPQFSMAADNSCGRNQPHRPLRLGSLAFVGSCVGKTPKRGVSPPGLDGVIPDSDTRLGIGSQRVLVLHKSGWVNNMGKYSQFSDGRGRQQCWL